jgi:hypothetical protein
MNFAIAPLTLLDAFIVGLAERLGDLRGDQ